MALSGSNGSAFCAAGDVNRDGFADHITAGASPRRVRADFEPPAYFGNGFADAVVGPPLVSVLANLPNATELQFVADDDDSGGIFVG